MPPRLSHQGRHPGDAHRRGHGRTLTTPLDIGRGAWSPRNILLIRLRLIGDVVFTTPAVAAIRARYPQARLSYLVEPSAEPVVRHNPHLDRVIVAERPRGIGRVGYDAALARRLRRERFDLVIDFHGGPRSAWVTWATGAPVRIGYAFPWRSWAYTERVRWRRALVPARHSVENQWDLLVPLGFTPPAPGQPPVEMAAHADAESRLVTRLRDAGVPDTAPIVLMHVSAGNPFRRWPAHHFVRCAATLARRDTTRRIIITSGPSERSAAEDIVRSARVEAGDAASAIVACGEFDLLELRALAARAAVYIGGDSGPLHVAATTRVPIVALFGPTLPERSMPWRAEPHRAIAIDAGPLPCRPCHQRQCEPGDFRCLTRVDAMTVVEAAERLLASESGRA